MASPGSNASRPGRMLALLAGVIVVMILAIVGADLASPGKWSSNSPGSPGLDLTQRHHRGAAGGQARWRHPGIGRDAAGDPDHEQPGERRRLHRGPGRAARQRRHHRVGSRPERPDGGLTGEPDRRAAVPPGAAGTPNAPPATPSATPSPSASASPSSSGAASPSPSASGAASPSARATPSPAPGSATSAWQQAQGDASLVSAPVKAQFNKLNCADKNWQQTAGYTKGQYTNPHIQIVSSDRRTTSSCSTSRMSPATWSPRPAPPRRRTPARGR